MIKDIRCKYCDALVMANNGLDKFRFSSIYFII